MTTDTKQAFTKVIEHLDNIMENSPSREVADLCNALQEMVDAL